MSQNTTTSSLPLAFFWVTLSYIIAVVAAVGVGYLSQQAGHSLIMMVALADLAATLVVFIFSYFFNNSSFYDPYWSLIPIFIVVYLLLIGWDSGANQLRMGIMASLVTFWGVRLTANWARGWTGLHHQDWRYVDLQNKMGKWYWLVSFSGIHLFPTVLVFLGCLALFPTFTLPGNEFGWLDILATLFTLGAILIEFIADEQLKKFVKTNTVKGKTLTTGLWAYSRHPNYFGETSFWWGLFFFALAARADYWWVIVGPLFMTFLFYFISIPMIEKRMLAKRPDYAEIMKRIPKWIPWFPKKG